MVLVCGVEEAGRGPVLGPMVVCGVVIDHNDQDKLAKLQVKDSKKLTPKKREELFQKIISVVEDHKLVILPPAQIDAALNDPNNNLNWLEAETSAKIINELQPDKAIIDCPSTNIEAYKERLRFHLLDKSVELLLEHKADENHLVVSAASILAKVTRDNEIKKIQEKIKERIGSGYPSDPVTISFLKKNYKKYPDIIRKSWAPYKEVVKGKNQSKLADFGDEDKPIVYGDAITKQDLELLKEYGYKKVSTISEHEILRMEGKAVVTLYKTGKLLIQGPKEEKEFIERLFHLYSH